LAELIQPRSIEAVGAIRRPFSWGGSHALRDAQDRLKVTKVANVTDSRTISFFARVGLSIFGDGDDEKERAAYRMAAIL